MALLRSQSAGGWQFERLMQRTRARLAQPVIPHTPLPTDRRPPPEPSAQEQREKLALFAVNHARGLSGLPPLAKLETPLQRPPTGPVADPKAGAQAILDAGARARNQPSIDIVTGRPKPLAREAR
jgi:hypothetical protein